MDKLDEILNRVEAMFDCGAGKPTELADYIKARPQRVSEWIRQRDPRPSGLTTILIMQWAAKISNRIAAGGNELQAEYRRCYEAVCLKRGN